MLSESEKSGPFVHCFARWQAAGVCTQQLVDAQTRCFTVRSSTATHDTCCPPSTVRHSGGNNALRASLDRLPMDCGSSCAHHERRPQSLFSRPRHLHRALLLQALARRRMVAGQQRNNRQPLRLMAKVNTAVHAGGGQREGAAAGSGRQPSQHAALL